MGKNLLLKLILIAGGIFVIFAVAIYILSQSVIMAGFQKVEEEDYDNKMASVQRAVEKQGDFLNGQTKDWAFWDDSYAFIADDDQSYLERNVLSDMLTNLDLDYFVMLDKDKKILYARVMDENGEETAENISDSFKEAIVDSVNKFEADKLELTEQEAIVSRYDKNVILSSISNVTKSDQNPPAVGFMVMGNYLNQERIQSIGEDIRLKLSVHEDVDNVQLPSTDDDLVGIQYLNDQKAKGTYSIKRYDGAVIAYIESEFDRNINSTATNSRNIYLAALYGVAVFAVFVAVYIFRRLVKTRQKQFEGDTKYQMLFNENVMPLFLIKLDKNWQWKEIVESNNAAKNLYYINENSDLLSSPINILRGMDDITIQGFLRTLATVGLSVSQGRLAVGQNMITVEIVGRVFNVDVQKYLLLSIKDLSERVQYEKKLEDYASNLRKFQLAVEHASDQIIITDTEGIIIYANRSSESISGFKAEEVVGKKAGTKELWGGLMEKEFYEKMWHTISVEKLIFNGDLKNKRKGGQEYDASLSVSPILNENGDVIFFVGIERDITKAKEVDRAKSEFVSLASHQLRTPLSSISWFTEMLLNQDAGKINDTQKEYLEEIYKGNKRMVALVNSLLNVSRIELGTFEVDPEPTNIIEIAQDIIKELEPEIKERQIEIFEKYDQLPRLMLDPKLTRIILQNFITNAVKYTPGKGKVTITIRRDTESLLISVTDTGFGIPQEQQDKIFSKLFRADNVKALDTEGNGLGLYIVKSIVEQSNGKIWFESKEGEGSTFYVSLPMTGMKQKAGSKPLE